MLQAEHITVGYDGNTILSELSVRLPKGKITALIGPNGCGKSTLLKALSRILTPSSGRVSLTGETVHGMPEKTVAQKISLLPQTLVNPEGITVQQLVEYGRTPYLSHWGRLSEEDRIQVAMAMEETGVVELAQRPLEALSGGQRQRVWIAMILAQNTDIVMLDEPTTYLDLSHQVELMNMMRAMNDKGKTVVVVLHDLNQACRYCDHLVVLKEGAIVTEGDPGTVFNSALLNDVFNLKASVIPDPVAGTPMCIPY